MVQRQGCTGLACVQGAAATPGCNITSLQVISCGATRTLHGTLRMLEEPQQRWDAALYRCKPSAVVQRGQGHCTVTDEAIAWRCPQSSCVPAPPRWPMLQRPHPQWAINAMGLVTPAVALGFGGGGGRLVHIGTAGARPRDFNNGGATLGIPRVCRAGGFRGPPQWGTPQGPPSWAHTHPGDPQPGGDTTAPWGPP